MKKLLPLILLLTPFTALARDSLLEFKAGCFFPTSDRYDDIYGKSGSYSFEYTTCLFRNIDAYASVGYLYDSGRSIGEGSDTSIHLVPLSLGAKYFVPLNCLWECTQLYVGAGGLATYVNIHDNSPFVVQRSRKWAWGGIIKSGVIFNLNQCWFIDVFADYSFLWVNFHNTDNGAVVRNRTNLSGFIVGAGIGIKL